MSKITKIVCLALCIAVWLPHITIAEPYGPSSIRSIAIKQVIVYAKRAKPLPESAFKMIDMITLAFPDVPVMVNIADAESHYIETIKNPTSSAKGLFQILDSTWKDAKCTGSVLVAADNIACAKKLYTTSGTTPWNASKGTWGH